MRTRRPDPEKSNSHVSIGDVGDGIYNSIIAGGNVIINSSDSSTILTSEHQADLDYAKDLLNSYKSEEALEYLEKLKNRIWSKTQIPVKYRIVANIGTAKLLQNQYQEATRHFIEALQYNPDDEKALCNVALGYLLVEHYPEAKTYAEKALVKNPAHSQAYAILIQTSSDTETLENIIAKVPELFRTTSEVAFAIGIVAHKQRHLLEAKQWLEIALTHDEKDHPELRGALAGVLLELVINDKSSINGLQLTDNQKAQIQQAIGLLDAALSRAARAERWNFRLEWLVNRGTAKQFLGDFEGAIRDIEKALEVVPSHPDFISRRARLAYETGDKEKAITLLKSILSTSESPDVPLLLAHILRSAKRSPEAIALVNHFLTEHPDDQFRTHANRALIELYLDIGDVGHATRISDIMRATEPTNVFNLVDAAHIALLSKNRDKAVSLLQEAKQYITPSSSLRQRLELANVFYNLEEFEDAARLYEGFVDPSLHTQLTYQLLMSYYHSGHIGKSLNVCQTLHQRYGILQHIAPMEATIYYEIGDLPNAKNVAQEYLISFPKHPGMKLLVAVADSRTGNIAELDNFLRSVTDLDIETLPLEFGIQLSQLYAERKQHRRAIEILYEMRRKFFDQSEAHLKYIQHFFLQGEREVPEWLRPAQVSVDTAVCLEEDSGERVWYIIDNRKDADIQRRELPSHRHLARKLIGQSVGNAIVLKETPFSKETAKIIEIQSKYLHALHESLALYEKLFPETPGLWQVNMTSTEHEGDVHQRFQPILDEISRQHDVYLLVEQWYNQGKFPISAFADLIGRNVIDVWGSIINNPNVGVKCCFGTAEERNAAFSLLEHTPRLVLDMIALLTLHHIQAQDVIPSVYGKLGIAQTTVDLLQHTIQGRQNMLSGGFATLGKDGDHFVNEDIPPEQVQRNLAYLERLKNWIESHCEILPCHAALHVKRVRKKQLEEAIGQAFIDTILIASEPGNILYSDDERLRALAKIEHNVNGVWTQVLLMRCLNTGILEQGSYQAMVMKLVTSHYYHTSIDAQTLIDAAKQAQWSPSAPYTTVLHVLREGFSEENSVVTVGADFLFELWKQDIWKQQPKYRDALIYTFFKAITTGRMMERTLEKLKTHVKRRFALLPFEEKEILSLIHVWKQTHIA